MSRLAPESCVVRAIAPAPFQCYAPKAMDPALIYARVSTKEQSDSLPVQEKKCRDFAKSQSLSVQMVFTDAGASARTDDRAQLQAMLAYCRKNKNKLKHVIVADLSRLARNVSDQGLLIAELAELGIRLRSVDENSLGDDATGTLGKNILGAISQYFSDSLSERTKFRMAAAVKNGRFVWRACLGYINKDKALIVDTERAPLIRKAFELIAAGNNNADDVLRTVNALGLRTHRGAPVTPQTFHALLRNVLLKGWVKSGDLLVRGVHQPIVPEPLFDHVQDVLAGRSKAAQPRTVLKEQFPLRQFVRCHKCGKGLTAGLAKGTFPYYWCYTKGCRSVFVPAAQLERSFVSLLASFEPTVEYLRLLPEIAKELWEKRREQAEQDSRALNIRLADQRRLNSQAIAAKLKGELSVEDFDVLKKSIIEESALIEEQIKALNSERSTMQELIAQTQRELIDLPAAWAKAGLNQKRELCEMLFPSGLVWRSEWGFLNSQNTSIMADIADDLNNSEDHIRFGVPDGI